jgi:DNA-binding HxlR family transcriptional regulator
MATTADLCALRRDVLGHVGSKWSSLVLMLLDAGPRRYSEIRRSCGISQRMLSLTLRELERDGLVAHGDTSGPYALSPAGQSLVSLVKPLIAWTDGHYTEIVESRGRYAAATTAAAMSDGRDSNAM